MNVQKQLNSAKKTSLKEDGKALKNLIDKLDE